MLPHHRYCYILIGGRGERRWSNRGRPRTSLLHRPAGPPIPPSPGPDPCDVAASERRHVRPQGPWGGGAWASDFQNLPAASWPRMHVPIQRPSARHVSRTGHVSIRCGAPAPKKLIRPQTSRLSASRSEKQLPAAAPFRRNQHQRLACLLAPLPSTICGPADSDRNLWIRRGQGSWRR
jgi:hypothetical protein